MEDHRTAWLALAVAMVFFGAGTCIGIEIARAEYPHTMIPFWPVWVGLVAILGGGYLFAAIVWHWPLPGAKPEAPEGSPDGTPQPLLVVTVQPVLSFAFMKREEKDWQPHSIELQMRGYAAAPLDGEPITLLWAKGRVQMDNGDWRDVETRVGCRWDKRFQPPEDIAYPPVVGPGRTVEIEWNFRVRALRTDDFPGSAIKPQKIIGADVIIVDQLQRPYPAISTVDFGPVMLVDQIPRD